MLLQVARRDRVADDVGGDHALVHARVRPHVLRQQVGQHVGPQRVPDQDERAPVVVVPEEVLEGSDRVDRRRAGDDLDLLLLGHLRARGGVGLAIVRRVDVAHGPEGRGLALERHLGARHHLGIVDGADQRFACSPHVFGRVEVEDVHLLERLLGQVQPVRARLVVGRLHGGRAGHRRQQRGAHQGGRGHGQQLLQAHVVPPRVSDPLDAAVAQAEPWQ